MILQQQETTVGELTFGTCVAKQGPVLWEVYSRLSRLMPVRILSFARLINHFKRTPCRAVNIRHVDQSFGVSINDMLASSPGRSWHLKIHAGDFS